MEWIRNIFEKIYSLIDACGLKWPVIIIAAALIAWIVVVRIIIWTKCIRDTKWRMVNFSDFSLPGRWNERIDLISGYTLREWLRSNRLYMLVPGSFLLLFYVAYFLVHLVYGIISGGAEFDFTTVGSVVTNFLEIATVPILKLQLLFVIFFLTGMLNFYFGICAVLFAIIFSNGFFFGIIITHFGGYHILFAIAIIMLAISVFVRMIVQGRNLFGWMKCAVEERRRYSGVFFICHSDVTSEKKSRKKRIGENNS